MVIRAKFSDSAILEDAKCSILMRYLKGRGVNSIPCQCLSTCDICQLFIWQMRNRATWVVLLILMAVGAQSSPRLEVEKTLKAVIKSMNVVANVSGRDIILVLGESQVGKSTAINALRGVQFKWQKVANTSSTFDLVTVLPLHSIALAEMGNGVSRTTLAPTIYEDIPGFAIVDNRGVGDMGKDQSGDVSASILMEMMCKAARSVRIVVLVSFPQICQVQTLRPLMKQIGNLIPDPSSNIFWLVNRHPSNRAGSDPLTQFVDTQIMQDLKGQIERIWRVVTNVKDEERLLDEAEITTLDAIHRALNAEPPRIGYLDPTSRWSAQHAAEKIKGMSAIPISEIKLGTENRHRPLFDNNLWQTLARETLLLVTHRVLSEIRPELISDTNKKNDLVSDLNHISTRIQDTDRAIQKLDRKINSTRTNSEIIWTDRFDLRSWFFLRREYRATYHSDLKHIPISYWKDTVALGTRRIDVYYQGNPMLPVIQYRSDRGVPCKGKVDFYVRSIDIPAVKEQLEEQEQWRGFLVRERERLTRQLKGQAQEIEERKADLTTIARAQADVSLVMTSTRREQIDEYEELVIRLWSPLASRPAGIHQVDQFLLALRDYRRFEKEYVNPRYHTVGALPRVLNYALAWLEKRDR
jgi:GTPase SAR1 family protein